MNAHMSAAKAVISPLLAIAIDNLAERIDGEIITAEMEDYDEARAVPHKNWDNRPLLIAKVSNAPDVADVVDFARRQRLEIAVRAGGHSVSGLSTSQFGVVIDLRGMKAIDLNFNTMTAWVGAGLTVAEVTAALDAHGLAIGFGDSGGVGISGLTLGGGMGYLSRKLGLTIDSVEAAEIVTADGSILLIDKTNEPDLFWAIRGGGGSFGVVTRWCYRLHSLPEFTGGPLVLPATPEILASFIAAAKLAPEALTSVVSVMKAPPLPFVPSAYFGQTIILAMMAFAGPDKAAQTALQPFRALANPIADLVKPSRLGAMYLPEPDGLAPALSVRSAYCEHFGIEQAAALIARIDRCEAPMALAQLRVLGGAVSRVLDDATAYSHRDRELLVATMAFDESVRNIAQNDHWATNAVAAVCGIIRLGYINFLGETGPDKARSCYSEMSWSKLRAVKRIYDRDNLFSRSHPIGLA